VLAGGLSPVTAAGLVGTSGSLLPAGVFMLAPGLISTASVALAQPSAKGETTTAFPFSAAPRTTS